MQLVAAYKDGLLASVIEYGPDSSNPNLHKQEAIRSMKADHGNDVSLVFADKWEDLPLPAWFLHRSRSPILPIRLETSA